MHIPILLKRTMGIFRSFVKTYGAGARPKYRHRSWYSVPSHQNITLFRSCWESGTHKYASLRSNLHMYLFFFAREYSKTANSAFWNIGKECVGLTFSSWLQACCPHPFFHYKCIAHKLAFCGQTCSTAPFFKIFSTSNDIVAFSFIEKFISFGSFFCFGLQRNRIWYSLTICKIFWCFVSFSQLSRKCTNLPAGGTVRIFELQNNFLPSNVQMTTLLLVSVVDFFFKKVVVLVTWAFELRLVVAFVPFLELESLLLRLKLMFRPRDEAYFTVRLSKRACGHAVAERLIHLLIYSKLSLPSIYT